MNTKKLLLIAIYLIGCVPVPLQAQSRYEFGGLPAINFNRKLKNNWSVNFKLESRQLLQSGTFGENDTQGYQYVLTDNTLIVAKKVGLNTRLSGGYLFRIEEGEIVHRIIQQYTVVQRLTRLRLGHRIVTDQTFTNGEDPEFRLRYRLATEIPLNGFSADTKEFYLKLSNEYLNEVQNTDYDLEVRLVPLLGYITSEHHKVEFGLDYRVNSFVNGSAEHTFWMTVNWFIE